jgi:hypothetical protein
MGAVAFKSAARCARAISGQIPPSRLDVTQSIASDPAGGAFYFRRASATIQIRTIFMGMVYSLAILIDYQYY